jgi:hypothetical protein
MASYDRRDLARGPDSAIAHSDRRQFHLDPPSLNSAHGLALNCALLAVETPFACSEEVGGR